MACWTSNAETPSWQIHGSHYIRYVLGSPYRKFQTACLLMDIVWGGLLMTTPACHNFAGIAINRFLLGVVEAVVTPGFVLMMGMWYTAEEQPLRLEAWYCTNGIATMFGG